MARNMKIQYQNILNPYKRRFILKYQTGISLKNPNKKVDKQKYIGAVIYLHYDYDKILPLL